MVLVSQTTYGLGLSRESQPMVCLYSQPMVLVCQERVSLWSVCLESQPMILVCQERE